MDRDPPELAVLREDFLRAAQALREQGVDPAELLREAEAPPAAPTPAPATAKPRRGREPALTREECASILSMYQDKNFRENATTLAHLFKVSPALVRRVLDGTYRAKDDPA